MAQEPQSSVAALLRQAKEALQERQYSRALQHARSVLQRDRDNYFAYVFVGAAAAGLGERERALQAYQRATSLRPTELLAWRGICESAADSTGAESDAYWSAIIQACDRCIQADLDKQNEGNLGPLLQRRWRALAILSDRSPPVYAFGELDARRLQMLFEYERREPEITEWMSIARCVRQPTMDGMRSLWGWFQHVVSSACRKQPATIPSYVAVGIRLWQCTTEREYVFQEWTRGAACADAFCLSALEELLMEDTAPRELVEKYLLWCQRIVHRRPGGLGAASIGWVLVLLASARNVGVATTERWSHWRMSGLSEQVTETLITDHTLVASLLQMGLGIGAHDWNRVSRASSAALDLIDGKRKQGRDLTLLYVATQLALGIAQGAQRKRNEAIRTLEAALETLHVIRGDRANRDWVIRMRCCVWRILAAYFWQQNLVESRRQALALCEQVLAVDSREPWAQIQQMEWVDELAASSVQVPEQPSGCACVDWNGHWSKLRQLDSLLEQLDAAAMPLGLHIIGWGTSVAASAKVRALAFLCRARHGRFMANSPLRQRDGECDLPVSELEDLLAAVSADPKAVAAYWALARYLWTKALALGGPRAVAAQPCPETMAEQRTSREVTTDSSVMLPGVASICNALDAFPEPFDRTVVDSGQIPKDGRKGKSIEKRHQEMSMPTGHADDALSEPSVATESASSLVESLSAPPKEGIEDTQRSACIPNATAASNNAVQGISQRTDTEAYCKSSKAAFSPSFPSRDDPTSQKGQDSSALLVSSAKASWYWFMAVRCLEHAQALEPGSEAICLKLLRAYSWEIQQSIHHREFATTRALVQRVERVCLQAIASSTEAVPWAWFTSGWFQYQSRAWRACALSLQKYLQMDDESAFHDQRHLLSWYALGEAYQREGKVIAACQALARSWQYGVSMIPVAQDSAMDMIVLVGTAYARLLAVRGQYTEALALIATLDRMTDPSHSTAQGQDTEARPFITASDRMTDPSRSTAEVDEQYPQKRKSLVTASPITAVETGSDTSGPTRERSCALCPTRTSDIGSGQDKDGSLLKRTPHGINRAFDRKETSCLSVSGDKNGTITTQSTSGRMRWLEMLLCWSLAHVRSSYAERLWLCGQQRAAIENWQVAMRALEKARVTSAPSAWEEPSARCFTIALRLLQRTGPAPLSDLFSRERSDTSMTGVKDECDLRGASFQLADPALRNIIQPLGAMLTMGGRATPSPVLQAQYLVFELLCWAATPADEPQPQAREPSAFLERLAALVHATSARMRPRVAGMFLTSLAFTGRLCYHDVEHWSLLNHFGRLDGDTSVVLVALSLLNERPMLWAKRSPALGSHSIVEWSSEQMDVSFARRGLEWLQIHHADSALGATLLGLVYEQVFGDLVMADRFYELGVLTYPNEPLAQLHGIRALLRCDKLAANVMQPSTWIRYAFYWERVCKHGLLWPQRRADKSSGDSLGHVKAQLDAYFSRNLAQMTMLRNQDAMKGVVAQPQDHESIQCWCHRYPDLQTTNPHQNSWNEHLLQP
jgi:tetratricopeptide (TPR) repeat protein